MDRAKSRSVYGLSLDDGRSGRNRTVADSGQRIPSSRSFSTPLVSGGQMFWAHGNNHSHHVIAATSSA